MRLEEHQGRGEGCVAIPTAQTRHLPSTAHFPKSVGYAVRLERVNTVSIEMNLSSHPDAKDL